MGIDRGCEWAFADQRKRKAELFAARQKRAIIMHDEGLSFATIAERLGVSAQAVKTLLGLTVSRAKLKASASPLTHESGSDTTEH